MERTGMSGKTSWLTDITKHHDPQGVADDGEAGSGAEGKRPDEYGIF